jgi:hypothetical protein
MVLSFERLYYNVGKIVEKIVEVCRQSERRHLRRMDVDKWDSIS